MTDPIVEDDYSNIPEELRDRRQWLLWDSAADAPRRPHWDGDFSISWNDPNDWHQFDEAVELARSVESWGIGYVFSDVGPYTFIDLDGCLRKRTRPKDWLPTLDPFVDETYIEVSASATGLHVILEGFEVPEWWTDTHFSDDEHEGVEVYEQKFCAFTGSPASEISTDTVGDVDATEWLIQAYKSINGENPLKDHADKLNDERDDTTHQSGAELHEDDIRDALEHIEPDVGYPTWRDIGFALKDFFGSNATALSVFKDWSRQGTKWDSDAEQQAERIIKDATAGGGRTIATVIHFAQQNGWEYPSKPHTSTDSSAEDSGSVTTTKSPAGELEHQHGRYGYEKKYYDEDGNVTEVVFDPVCNFTIETLSYLSMEDGQQLKLRIHPAHPMGEPYEVRVEPSVFNSGESFKNEIVTGRTTAFEPSNRKDLPTSEILGDLRRTVGSQDAPEREGTEFIGLSDDYSEWVTPEGSLTADGWDENANYEYYVKTGQTDESGAVAQKWQLERDDGSDYDRDEIRDILELLPQIRQPGRGLPILGWFYAAPLKPLITEWSGEFNLLEVTGETGSGKTTTLQCYWQLFGADTNPFSASDTGFTIEKHMAESCGLPVWIDEYKPADIPDHRLDRLHRRLREVTRERTISKGTQSLDEITFTIRAPVVISGEQKFKEAAVRRRAVMTNLTQAATERGTDTIESFGELTGTSYEDETGDERYPEGYELSQHALAYYQWVLGRETENLRELWNEAKDETKNILSTLGITVESTEEQGLQTVVFGVRLYQQFADAHDVADEVIPGRADLRESIRHVVSNIGKDGTRREHTDEWLELLTLAANAGYITEGKHFKVTDSRNHEKEVLDVHMPSSFSAVMKYVREFNLEGEYTTLSKGDYLDAFKNKREQSDSYIVETGVSVRNIENGRKCVRFDPDIASRKLGGDFTLSAFTDTESEGDGDPSAATPIAELDAKGNPYATVTVRVNNWKEGPDGGPAETGVLEDETGIIDVVDFFGCPASGQFEEENSYRVENARVTTYEDTLQLEIVQNTTDVTEIQEGASHSPSSGPGGDDASQTSLEKSASDADDRESSAAADGGREQPQTDVPDDASGTTAKVRRVVSVLESLGEASRSELKANLGTQMDMPPEKAEAAIRDAFEHGAIYDRGDDQLIVT